MCTYKGFAQQCSMKCYCSIYIVVLKFYGGFARLYSLLKQMTLSTFVVTLICNLIIRYIIL